MPIPVGSGRPHARADDHARDYMAVAESLRQATEGSYCTNFLPRLRRVAAAPLLRSGLPSRRGACAGDESGNERCRFGLHAGEDVGVLLHCEGRVLMAKALADHLYRYACSQGNGGVCVSEVVKPDAGES